MTARRRHTPPDAPRPAPVPSSDAERLKRLYLRPLAPDGLERLAAEVGWDAPPADAGLDALDYLATDPAVTPEQLAHWVRDLGYRFTMTDALDPIIVNLHAVSASGACAVVVAGDQRVEVPTDAREDQPHWFMKIVAVRVLLAVGVPARAIAIELTRDHVQRDRRADVYADRRSIGLADTDLWFECGHLDAPRREEIQARRDVRLIRVIRSGWFDRWSGRRVTYHQILTGRVPPHDVMVEVIEHNRQDLVPQRGQLWVVDVSAPMPELVVAVQANADRWEWLPGDRPTTVAVADADGPVEWDL